MTSTARRRTAVAGLAVAATVGGTAWSTAPAGAQPPAQTQDHQNASAPTRVRPVSEYRVSARYGQRGGRWSSGRHTGLDFAAPHGRQVRAAQAGRVASAGWDGPYGRSIVIGHGAPGSPAAGLATRAPRSAHGNGLRTRYAHLSGIRVRPGDRVQAGTPIGRIGSTGNSTGPHLHFEVLREGRHRDPARWLRAR